MIKKPEIDVLKELVQMAEKVLKPKPADKTVGGNTYGKH